MNVGGSIDNPPDTTFGISAARERQSSISRCKINRRTARRASCARQLWRRDDIRSVSARTGERRDQRNELSENREPLCVHSVGNEAGEHSWWYLSFLGALATRCVLRKNYPAGKKADWSPLRERSKAATCIYHEVRSRASERDQRSSIILSSLSKQSRSSLIGRNLS